MDLLRKLNEVKHKAEMDYFLKRRIKKAFIENLGIS